MTEREQTSAVLLMLKNLQEGQTATRKDVHDLRSDLQEQHLAAALERQKVSIRLDALEARKGTCGACSVGTAAVAVQRRSRREQAGYASVGVVALALVVKLVEVVGSEVVQHAGKLIASSK